jgi:hypothetical protein
LRWLAWRARTLGHRPVRTAPRRIRRARAWHVMPLALVVLLALAAYPAVAGTPGIPRAARAAFMRGNPCPATGRRPGACAGFVVDHGATVRRGADRPFNMQWQAAGGVPSRYQMKRRPPEPA